jgi:hypothetical protein
MANQIGPVFLRRFAAGEYLQKTYGFCSAKSLAKLSTTGGGPIYRKAGVAVLYAKDDLDAWALSKIGGPQSSTSDKPKEAA